MCPPELAGGESMWVNAAIIDGDARYRAFRGLANGDNGTCLIGGPFMAIRRTARRMRRPKTLVVNRGQNGRGMPLPYNNN